MLTLRQLEAFYWTAKLGTFTLAAKRMKMTQSAISMRISELETDIRAELFYRGRRAPVITPRGKELLDYAEQILRLSSEAHERISRKELVPQVLRIGFAEVISSTWLPQFVRAIHARHPKISLLLEEALIEEVFASLKRGTIDLALAAGMPNDQEVHSVSLGGVKFEWMASPSFLLPQRTLRPLDLQELPMIALARGSIHFQTINEWFKAGGATAQRVYSCKSLHVAGTLAAAGLGVTLLPPRLYQREIKGGQLIVVPTRPALPAVQYSAISTLNNLSPFIREMAKLAARSSTFGS